MRAIAILSERGLEDITAQPILSRAGHLSLCVPSRGPDAWTWLLEWIKLAMVVAQANIRYAVVPGRETGAWRLHIWRLG